jgi:hypothetical protein
MEPVAKAYAMWFVSIFESCLNSTEIIMSRYYVVYAIMRGELIRVGRLIARSIKRLVDMFDKWALLHHPQVVQESS